MSIDIIFGIKGNNNKNKIFVTQDDFESSRKNAQVYNAVFSYPKTFHNIRFQGLSLPELFAYEDIPIIWLFTKFFLDPLTNIFDFIIKFSKLIEKTHPDSIQIDNDYSKFYLIQNICKKYNIPLKYSRTSLLKYNMLINKNKSIKTLAKNYFFQKNVSNRVKLFFSKEASLSINNKILVIGSSYLWRPIIKIQTGKIENGNDLLENILFLLSKKSKVCCAEPLSNPRGSTDTLIQRMKSEYSWFPIEIFLKNNKDKNNYLKKYQKIIDSKEFQDKFEFNGIKIWKELEPVFLLMKEDYYIPKWLDLIYGLSESLKLEKPKAVIFPHETEPINQILINICRKNGVKTIGLQHGSGTNHYVYASDRLQDYNQKYLFPIPDKTLVFGNLSKNELLSFGFPPDSVEVLGNPNFFNLDKLMNILKNESSKRKFNLEDKKKLILFATSGVEDKYDLLIWKHLLNNLSFLKNYQIVLKTHPQDNPNTYTDLIPSEKKKNFSVITTGYYELIFHSEVIISTRSTIINDALIFNKPVIQVKFEDSLPSAIEQYKDIVIFSDIKNLINEITNLINDKSLRDKLSKNSTKYIGELYNTPNKNPDAVFEKIIDF